MTVRRSGLGLVMRQRMRASTAVRIAAAAWPHGGFNGVGEAAIVIDILATHHHVGPSSAASYRGCKVDLGPVRHCSRGTRNQLRFMDRWWQGGRDWLRACLNPRCHRASLRLSASRPSPTLASRPPDYCRILQVARTTLARKGEHREQLMMGPSVNPRSRASLAPASPRHRGG